MNKSRCDAVSVQIIVTTYDEHGRPIGESLSAPTKVFRATTLDFWREVDKAVAGMQAPEPAAASAPSPAPPASVRGKRR